VVGSLPEKCWLFSVCTAVRGCESTGQVLAILCMYCCAWLGVYRTSAGYSLYVLLCVCGSLPDKCWLFCVCTAVRGWESTEEVLAILCMYCCAWLGVYWTGAGYSLYVLLCVVGSLPDKCWLYSVCTAVGMSLPDVCWLFFVCTAVCGCESAVQVLAILCMYCCAWLGVYWTGAGYSLYELLCVVGSLPDKCWLFSVCTAVGMSLPDMCWLFSVCTAVRGWESTGLVLAILCMYCCAWLEVYRTGAGYSLYVLLCVVGSLPDRCWLFSVCTAVLGWESTGQVLSILCMYCCGYESTGHVLAIFCMYCCAWVGIYRRGAGYNLYVLLCV
jgi:hypothetical protein